MSVSPHLTCRIVHYAHIYRVQMRRVNQNLLVTEYRSLMDLRKSPNNTIALQVCKAKNA